LEHRATHRAPSHRVTRRAERLGSAAVTAALLALPLATAAPAHADVSSQWPLQYLKADQVWNITKGSGMTVAVLDTGVASIPDTQGDLLSGADFSSGTTSNGNGQTDTDGHGTQMAVMIAGSGSTYEGLAPDAKILPVRITTGGVGNPDDMAAGIRYAISQNAAVINLSQGTAAQSPVVAGAIQAALDANIVVVAASGNAGSSSVDYPAAYSGVVAVGATDQSGSIWSDSNSGPQVTLVAPGVAVPAEDNFGNTGSANGTSASTAYVSATVALIRAAHPSWTAGQVIRDLISTANPPAGQDAGQRSDQYGYGILNPLGALQASAPSQTTNPLLTSSNSSATSAAPTTGASTPGATASPSSSSSAGLIIGILVAALTVILIIVSIIILNRRNKNRPGGPGAGGPGGSGGGQPYGQYPQHNPYGQQQYPYPQNPQYPPQQPYPQQGQPPQR